MQQNSEYFPLSKDLNSRGTLMIRQLLLLYGRWYIVDYSDQLVAQFLDWANTKLVKCHAIRAKELTIKKRGNRDLYSPIGMIPNCTSSTFLVGSVIKKLSNLCNAFSNLIGSSSLLFLKSDLCPSWKPTVNLCRFVSLPLSDPWGVTLYITLFKNSFCSQVERNDSCKISASFEKPVVSESNTVLL